MDKLVFMLVGMAIIAGGRMAWLICKHGWAWYLARLDAKRAQAAATLSADVQKLASALEPRVSAIEAEIKSKIGGLGTNFPAAWSALVADVNAIKDRLPK